MKVSYEFLSAVADARNLWAKDINDQNLDEIKWAEDWDAKSVAYAMVTCDLKISEFARPVNQFLFSQAR